MTKYIVTSDRIEATEHEDKENAVLDYAYRKFFDQNAKLNEITEVSNEENGKSAEESQN